MPLLGLDTSHFQGSPSMGAVRAAGRDFIVLKATEGTNFVDLTCNGGYDAVRKVQVPSNRAAAHAAGLIVGLYHFARGGDVAAEAAWFVKTVGKLQPGEFLVLDQEVPNTVAWCKAWLDAVKAATGVAPLIYMNKGAATGVGMGDWSTVAKTYGLWLAAYDGLPAAQNAVPYWGVPAMKQYSDAGSVLGVAGTCDVNAFYGSRDQLLAYGKGGTPVMSATGPEKWDQADWQALVGRIFDQAYPRVVKHSDGSVTEDGPPVSLAQLVKWYPLLFANIAGDVASKVVAALPTTSGGSPAVSAQQVADLVIAALGQRISTPPAA